MNKKNIVQVVGILSLISTLALPVSVQAGHKSWGCLEVYTKHLLPSKYFPGKYTYLGATLAFAPNHSNNGSAAMQNAFRPFAAAGVLLGITELADLARSIGVPFEEIHRAVETSKYGETFRLMTNLQLLSQEVEQRLDINADGKPGPTDEAKIKAFLKSFKRGRQKYLYADPRQEQIDTYFNDPTQTENAPVLRHLLASEEFRKLQKASSTGLADLALAKRLLEEYSSIGSGLFCGPSMEGELLHFEEVVRQFDQNAKEDR